MKNKFLIIIISFLFLFIPIKSFAYEHIYKLDKSAFDLSEYKTVSINEKVDNTDQSVALINLFLPGMAQITLGNNISGIAFISASILFTLTEFYTLYRFVVVFLLNPNNSESDNLNNQNEKNILIPAIIINTVLLFVIQIWSLIDAYNIIKTNKEDLENINKKFDFLENNLSVKNSTITINLTSYNF